MCHTILELNIKIKNFILKLKLKSNKLNIKQIKHSECRLLMHPDSSADRNVTSKEINRPKNLVFPHKKITVIYGMKVV